MSTASNGRTTVRIPGPLRGLAGGADDVAVEGVGTVGDALDVLCGRHPSLRRHLRTEAGSLREHVNVYLNEDDIRYLEGEATPLRSGDVITVVPSIAGG
jgi:sulfur-carrier protein